MKKFILLVLGLSTILMATDVKELEAKIESCKSGDYNACNFMGDDMLFKKKHMEANYFYAMAKEFMTKECDKGDYTACYNLGFNFEMGSPVYQKDEEKAKMYYMKEINHNKKRCEKQKDDLACFNLGLDFSDKGIMNNKEEAKKYFSKSCELGNERGCAKLKEL